MKGPAWFGVLGFRVEGIWPCVGNEVSEADRVPIHAGKRLVVTQCSKRTGKDAIQFINHFRQVIGHLNSQDIQGEIFGHLVTFDQSKIHICTRHTQK